MVILKIHNNRSHVFFEYYCNLCEEYFLPVYFYA